MSSGPSSGFQASSPFQATGATISLLVQTRAVGQLLTGEHGPQENLSSSPDPGLRCWLVCTDPSLGPPGILWRGKEGEDRGRLHRGSPASTSSTASRAQAMWPPNKAPLRAADEAGSPGTQCGWLHGPGPTKTSLNHRRPPAEPEVAVAPGACHLMTVLAGPDVPQTSATAVQGPPGQPAPQRPL